MRLRTRLAATAYEFAHWEAGAVEWEFDAEVFQWRGPAPYFFVETPDDVDAFLHDHAAELTYGWGVIPGRVRIDGIEIGTSLIPRHDVYLVPLKVALRRPLGIDDGDVVHIELSVSFTRLRD